MVNMHDMAQDVGDEAGSFPVTISLEAFHTAATEVYVQHLRNLAVLTQGELGFPLAGIAESGIFNPDQSAAEIGITYQQISTTPFAKTLNVLYDFAFFARLDMTAEDLADETHYTFISMLLADAAYGYATENWRAFGNPIQDHAQVCLLVAEIANARGVLEGMESFFGFYVKGRGASDDAVGFDTLTIRQMALLSGMEEQSVRAAANPKRANRLHTTNEDGRTRVSPASAKLWLKSKGRYMPVARYLPDREMDFTKRGFADAIELLMLINHRYQSISTRGDREAIDKRLKAKGMKISRNIQGEPCLFLDDPDLDDVEKTQWLAELLEWPPEIFSLRCKEALAKTRLADIERVLRAATKPQENK